MLLDEILVNLSESAIAEHPEGCDCEECKKQAAEKVEECSEAHDFWTETGIDESEERELEAVNAKMRKLMAKRSQCASGSAKQEKINDELDKIYDRRHELMSKKTLNEDGEGTKVLEALEDINDETELDEKTFDCQKAEYGLKSGKFICDGKDITDEIHSSADKAGKAAANVAEVDEAQELYDTVTSALDEDEAFKGAVKGAYDAGKDTVKGIEKAVSNAKSFGKSVQGTVDTVKDAGKALKDTGKAVKDFYNKPFDIFEDSEKLDEYEGTTKNNAEAGAGIGADIGRWIGKGLDKAKEYGKQAIDYADKEFGKAREALYKDTANLREEEGTLSMHPGMPRPQQSEEKCQAEKATDDELCNSYEGGCKYLDRSGNETDKDTYYKLTGCDEKANLNDDEMRQKVISYAEKTDKPENDYEYDGGMFFKADNIEPISREECEEDKKMLDTECPKYTKGCIFSGKNGVTTREDYMRQLGCNEEDEKGPWDPENQDPEKRYMLDAETSAPEVIEYDEAAEQVSESTMYKVSKADGSNEYIMVESAEKFAEYINESFEDIVSFEKINTEALNESMDHEIVDTVVAEVSKDKKASMGEIQSMLNDMVDDSMSEEFVKTIYNKIVNRLSDAGIEVVE